MDTLLLILICVVCAVLEYGDRVIEMFAEAD